MPLIDTPASALDPGDSTTPAHAPCEVVWHTLGEALLGTRDFDVHGPNYDWDIIHRREHHGRRASLRLIRCIRTERSPMSTLERIYTASPVALQNLFLSAYGLVLYRRRFGRQHARLKREIEGWERLSPREMYRREGLRLRDTVTSAAERVPYYREMFRRLRIDPRTIDSRDRLQALPLLDKHTVRQQPARFHAEAVGGSLSVCTSGSTGSPLTVRCNRDALQGNYAHFYRLRERLGIAARDRCATFAGRTIVPAHTSAPPYWRHNLVTNTLLFSTYHITPASIDDYLERLASFRPALIDSYPSALGLIASRARELGIHIRPRAILTSSETLTEMQRHAAEEAFECQVTDQYGSAEMVAFIAQCTHGTYHAWPSYGIAEVLVDGRPARPGEAGELVCTGFINPAMPLLRYRTGDMAVAGDGCPCGSPYPSIVGIEGRMDDILVTPDGRRVGRLDPVFKGAPDDAFHEAQIVQEALDRVTLRYVRGTGQSQEAVAMVLQELRKRLGPHVRVDSEEVAGLERGANGKLRAVITKVAHAPRPEERKAHG